MRYRRWELTIVIDGERDVSHHRTESAAWQALVETYARTLREWLDNVDLRTKLRLRRVPELTEDERDEVRDALADAGVDFWIDEDIIDTNEWEPV